MVSKRRLYLNRGQRIRRFCFFHAQALGPSQAGKIALLHFLGEKRARYSRAMEGCEFRFAKSHPGCEFILAAK